MIAVIRELSLSDMESGFYYQPGLFWHGKILQAAANSGEKIEKIFLLAILDDKEMIDSIPFFGSRRQCLEYYFSDVSPQKEEKQ